MKDIHKNTLNHYRNFEARLINIRNAYFGNIISGQNGSALYVENADVRMHESEIISCKAPSAAGIYCIKSSLVLGNCCFLNLSVVYTGNDNEGIVIDVTDTPVEASFCNTFLCAPSSSLGADSTYAIRSGTFEFYQINFTDCLGVDGCCTIGRDDNELVKMMSYCDVKGCDNFDLIEFFVDVKSSNFVDCYVTCFGYIGINFEKCFFKDIVSSHDDYEPVEYINCVGVFPNHEISGVSVDLSIIQNKSCFFIPVHTRKINIIEKMIFLNLFNIIAPLNISF